MARKLRGSALQVPDTVKQHFPFGEARKMAYTLLLCAAVATVALFAHDALTPRASKAAAGNRELALPARRDWDDGVVANTCVPIFEKLREKGLLCGKYAAAGSCAPPRGIVRAGAVKMFSQHKQDAYLYMNHFKSLKRRGVYLDIASNDPIRHSNTYFYDRCLGWRGVCVEGNPSFYEATFRERSCLLVPTCVGRTDGETVRFALKGLLGGIVGETYKHRDKFNRSKLTTVEARCTTVEMVLERAGVRRVDFLSLDVEGHEYEVLRGIAWDRVEIGVITVERSGEFEKVERLLKGLGYRRHAVGADGKVGRPVPMDAIFVHRDVEFGEAV